MDLRSNYVVLGSTPSYKMYSYRVNICPFIDNLLLCNTIIQRMLKDMDLPEKTGSVESRDYTDINVFNQLLREFMHQMGRTEMGRKFLDTKNPAEIREHKLTLLPGYVTSIRNHDSRVLPCVQTANKIIHHDTVLETIEDKKSRDSTNYRRAWRSLLD